MPVSAIGTAVGLRYVPEVTWGTTPATPAMQAVRFTGFQPKYTRTTVESKELTTAREIQDYIRTQEEGGFTINFETSSGLLDDWLQAIFGGSWTSDVLKIGTTRQSFTFEVAFADIGQFAVWTGCVPSDLSLTVVKGQILGGSITFVANPCTWATAVITGETVTPAETNTIMDPISSVQLIQQGGSGSVSGPQEFTLAVKNNPILFPQLSSINYADIELGQVAFTGTLKQYFSDRVLVDIATAYTDTSLALTIGGVSSQNLAFLWSKIKLSLSNLSGIAVNSAVIGEFTWTAKTDATNSSCKITRTA